MNLLPVLLIALGVGCGAGVQARNLGVIGETFPVAEMSMLDWINARVTALEEQGEFAAIEKRWIENVEAHSNRPQSVGLTRALENRDYAYSPEVVLSQDIVDAQGRVLFLKGTRVNALDKLPTYKPHWIFIDGDDAAQVAFAHLALKRWTDSKIILTGGAVGELERELNYPIYFDQGGRLTTKLQIHHVPAYVTRDGNQLHIHEVAIREDGHAR